MFFWKKSKTQPITFPREGILFVLRVSDKGGLEYLRRALNLEYFRGYISILVDLVNTLVLPENRELEKPFELLEKKFVELSEKKFKEYIFNRAVCATYSKKILETNENIVMYDRVNVAQGAGLVIHWNRSALPEESEPGDRLAEERMVLIHPEIGKIIEFLEIHNLIELVEKLSIDKKFLELYKIVIKPRLVTTIHNRRMLLNLLE